MSISLDQDGDRICLEEYLKECHSKESAENWLSAFDHFSKPNFAIYYFEQINDALNIFREIEPTEPTRIQLHKVLSPPQNCDKNKRPKDTAPILDVNDDQAFPALGETPKSGNATKKRVTPRRISTKAVDGNAKFIKSNYSIQESASSTNFRNEREELKMLKKKPGKFQQKVDSPTKSSSVQEAPVTATSDSQVESTPEKVDKPKITLKYFDDDKIVALKIMFIDFLQKSLFVRPMTFNDLLIINLQVLNRDPTSVPNFEANTDGKSPIKTILNSQQKCFQFSYLIFEEVFLDNNLLNQLTIQTLLAIQNNETLMNYDSSKNVRARIDDLIQLKYDYLYNRSGKSGLQQFVSYDINLDSIENFSNSNGFYNFRRQRDYFNSLLESYYKNSWRFQLTSDDKSMFTFINKIHATMSSKSFYKFNNFPQLSKLFVEQMLKSCLDKSFLLVGNQNNKVELLESRLTKSSTNIKNIPDFINQHFRDEELFFKDFIFYGDSHMFNKHLLNSMKHSLKEFQISLIEILNTDDCNDEEYSDEFCKLFYFNTLLSKFIGFIDFYPYFVDKEANDKKIFIENQTELRQNCNENIDILDCLLECFNESHLFLIHVPSIVEYLLFHDCVSLQNPKIQHSIFVLSAIYKFYLPKITFNKQSSKSNFFQTRFSVYRQILQLFLDRFFESKSLNPDKIIENIDMIRIYYPQISMITLQKDDHGFDFGRLDLLVNPLFFSSEYCEAFSKILQDIFDNKKEKRYKNITMLSLLSKKNLLSDSRKHLEEHHYQNLLFEKFFSHSKSLKKCCDFVVESTYKNLISILNKKVSTYQELLIAEKISQQSEIERDYEPQDKDFQMDDQNIELLLNKLREHFLNEFQIIYQQKSQNLLVFVKDNGFSEDAQETILAVCSRKVENLCKNWFTKHYNIQHLTAELKKTKQQSSTAIDQISAEQSMKVSSFLEMIRTTIPNLRYGIEAKKPISFENILDVYLQTRQLPDPLQIDIIFSDFMLTFLIKRPSEINQQFIDKLMKRLVEHKITFPRLISPPTLVMLENELGSVSWEKYRLFLLAALKYRRIDFDNFQNSQIIPLLKLTWHEDTLKRLADILDSFVDAALKLGIVSAEDNIILDWMSWLLNDL